jgi:hypothetical protein
MNKDQYKKRIMAKRQLTESEFDKKFVVLECKNCDYEGCHGWQVCLNDPEMIRLREEANARDDDA